MRLPPSEYFAREVVVSEIGPEGLERLREGKVAVVGAGGVGSVAAQCMVRSGLGYLRVIDQDIVEPSNLHRLHGASEDDLYKPKAEVAAEALAKASPWAKVEPVIDTLRWSNARHLLDGVDLVVDCLDND